MNPVVFRAARRAGCSPREAEVLATYAGAAKLAEAARQLGISERAAANALDRARRRFDAPHTTALMMSILMYPGVAEILRNGGVDQQSGLRP